MDLTNLPTPVFTRLDGVTQGIAAVCYLAVGIAAWMRAAHDIRTRVFVAFSIANVIVFGIPTLWWLRGTTDPRKLPPAATAAIMAGLGAGALVLFHFTQVFPRRRPWIKTSGIQMPIAYCLAPPAIAGLFLFAPATPGELTVAYALSVIVFGLPLLILLGIVLPVAAIVSLLRSHREAGQQGLAHLKRPLEWILVSQIAGGTLTIVFAPVLTVLTRNEMVRSGLTLAIWALGLLTPLAFAAAVWKYNVLAISADDRGPPPPAPRLRASESRALGRARACRRGPARPESRVPEGSATGSAAARATASLPA